MRIGDLFEGHVKRNGAAFSFRGLRLHFYWDHVFYVVEGGPNLSIYRDGVATPRNDEIYVKDAAARGVPKDIIQVISYWLNTPRDKQEALLPRIEAALNHIIDGWLSQSTKKKESKMKMSELDNRLPDNFSIDDIKKMERMTDINQMKAYAKELISTPSQKPMRPEKVAWLKKTIDSKRKPIDVIKLMYDLMLGGEGKHVIGSRHSMDPNVYRKTFKEEDGKTMSRAGKGVMKYGKDGMKALAKAGRDGANDEKLDKLRDKYDKYDEGTEPDHEASMAKGQLYNAAKNAVALMKMIDDGDNLEGWVASKISRAADYLNSVHDYMAYEEVSEGKQKGVDGKACWKGYKRMGTKQKGGKTVDNCVKIKK